MGKARSKAKEKDIESKPPSQGAIESTVNPEKKRKRAEESSKEKKKRAKSTQTKTKARDNEETTNLSLRRALNFPHRFILGPMVGASELAFRLLCRRYGTELAYTPMMSAEKFANDASYRQNEFQTCAEDRPLVCHFAANNPENFARSASLVEPVCDAIDLNLGCPQRTAYLGHFGSYLLDPEDRELVCSIIRAGAKAVKIPIFCKIRLLDTLEDTIQLCSQLRDAGASLIAIHARYRASWERKGPGARDGPAILDHVRRVKEAITDIPIITNGNTITFGDVEENLTVTKANGLMSAEGILDNPALFLPRFGAPTCGVSAVEQDFEKQKRKLLKKLKKIGEIETKMKEKGNKSVESDELEKVKKRKKIEKKLKALQDTATPTSVDAEKAVLSTTQQPANLANLLERSHDKIGLVEEYLELVLKYPITMRTIIFHTRRILKDSLVQYQLMEECLSCDSIDSIQKVIAKIKHYQTNPAAFVFDTEKAKKEKDALERKKREEGKRKAFEERMVRKAKREGKKDRLHYLHIGAEVPTPEIVRCLKALPRQEALDKWKQNHSQHCLSFHLDAEGCRRGRACAFLHVEVLGSNAFDERDEVAG